MVKWLYFCALYFYSKEKRMNPQVKKEHYKENYDTMDRFISYHFQIKSALKLNPKNVLEIGIGNKVVANYIKDKGIKIITCDIDKNLKPDYVADIRKLPFKDNSFDVVMACEVLEHIPYTDFKKALKEIKRVSNKFALVSIPYSTLSIYGYLKLIPGTKPKAYFLNFAERFLKKHKFDGQHYWEMGKKGFSKKRIKSDIKSTGWKIVKEFAQPLDPYHYFFILKKIS